MVPMQFTLLYLVLLLVPVTGKTERRKFIRADNATRRERKLGESNDVLKAMMQTKYGNNNYKYMHLIVEAQYIKREGDGLEPADGVSTANLGDVLVGNNIVRNTREQRVGLSKQMCIAGSNWICTWNIFSAFVKSGCEIMAQGFFIRGEARSFGIPVEHTIAIVGGTGPCRGARGQIKISPRDLQKEIPTYDYEFIYRVEDEDY